MQVDVEGSGPSLVLVHSLLTDSHAFDTVAPILAKERTVVRVSLPGFGSTPALPSDSNGGAGPTIYDIADAVAVGLAEAEVEDSATVLGNGLGAFVCAAMAIKHGNSFGPLIMANGGASFSDERRLAFTKMSDLVDQDGMEAVVDLAVRRIFPESYIEQHREVIAERRAVLVKTDPTAFAAACRALRDMDLRPEIGSISNPTLVIGGGADQTTPPEMGRELADGIDGATYVEVDGCGHCPPLENPDAFVAAIESFLSAN